MEIEVLVSVLRDETRWIVSSRVDSSPQGRGNSVFPARAFVQRRGEEPIEIRSLLYWEALRQKQQWKPMAEPEIVELAVKHPGFFYNYEVASIVQHLDISSTTQQLVDALSDTRIHFPSAGES